MTTFQDILDYVKRQARISGTARDTQLADVINQVYREVCGSDYWAFLRVPYTIAVTGGTQNYALPSNYERIASEGVSINTTGATYGAQPLEQVYPPDSELWESFQSTYLPQAFTIVAGSTLGLRSIRLLPQFTAIGQTISFVYYKQPPTLSGTDVVGDPLICDAIAYGVLASDKDWSRDQDFANTDYNAKYQRALNHARSANFP